MQLSLHKLGHARTDDGRDGAARATTYYERTTRADHEGVGLTAPPEERSMGTWYVFGLRAPCELDEYHGTPEDLEQALRGEWRGQAVQNAHAMDRVLGWDLTFSTAKSVSVAYATGDREARTRIENAMVQSVLTAIREVVAPEMLIRRDHAGVTREPASFAVIVYTQHLSRANDPQLHCHCILPNYGWGSDGIARTLETADVYRSRVAIGQVASAELAARLRALGFEVFRGTDGNVRVAGVSQQLEAHFAKRAAQIEEALGARFGADVLDAALAGQRELMTVLSRPRHDLHYVEDWREQAIAAGLRRDWHEAARASVRGREDAQTHATSTPGSALTERAEMLDAVAREAAAVAVHAGGWSVARVRPHPGEAVPALRRVVEETAARAVGTGADAREVLAAVERARVHGDIRAVEHGETPLGALVTTPAMIQTEQQLVADWQALAKSRTHGVPIPEGTLEGLSPEQQDAVRAATEDSGVGMVVGVAGTGKTTVFRRIREAYETAGYRVVGEAYSATAAQELQRGSGIASCTIALAETTSRDLDQRAVLVLDEAGRIPSPELARIVDEVRTANAKLILSGDWRQLQPIGPGAALPYLAMETARVAAEASAELQTIRRQTDTDLLRVAEAAATGNAAVALRAAAAQECVTVRPTTDMAVHEAARRVADALEHGSAVGLVAYRIEAWHLNQAVRTELQARGRLPGDAATYMVGASRVGLAPGDLVSFTRNRYHDLGVRNGQRAEVIAVSEETREVLLCLTERGREDRQGNVLRHGVPARFHDGTREHIISDPERAVVLGPEAIENGLIRHDYARTVDAAQGMTVDRAVVFAHYDTQRMDRQWAAVAFTRARHDLRIVLGAEGVVQAEQETPTYEGAHWPSRRQGPIQHQLPLLDHETVAAVLGHAESLMARDRPGATTLTYSATDQDAEREIGYARMREREETRRHERGAR